VLILAIGVGLLIGLIMALGGGGSLLTVPALVPPGAGTRAATTGSLIIVGVTGVFAMLARRSHGRVRVLQGIAFGPVGVAGSVAGSRLSLAVPADVLLAGFSLLMLAVAGLMLSRVRTPGRGGGRSGSDPVPPEVPIVTFSPRFVCACPRAARVVVAATVVGLVTGFFGVGGGLLVVPALVLALDFPMPIAVGTSLLVIAINRATALTAQLGPGIEVDWPVIAMFAAAAVAGGLAGTRIVGRLSPGALRAGFAVLDNVVGLYTAAHSIPALIA
jgi:uncharacterized membrane protein YfcA